MRCLDCDGELERFSADGGSLDACPRCLSVLVASGGKSALAAYCRSRLLGALVGDALELSRYEPVTKPPECPRCGYRMEARGCGATCASCGSAWLQAPETPLAALAAGADEAFRREVIALYELWLKRHPERGASFEESAARFAAVPLMFLAPPNPYAFAWPTDDNMAEGAAPVTWALIAVNTALIVLGGGRPLEAFVFYPRAAIGGLELYRFVTYAFVHAGWLHWGGNMWFLWLFGRSVERRMGATAYTLLYLISAAASALLFTFFIRNGLVGASGAISGVTAAYLVLFPKGKLRFSIFMASRGKRVPALVPAWWYLGAWLALNAWYAVSLGARAHVAYWGHIGGFIAGVRLARRWRDSRHRLTPMP